MLTQSVITHHTRIVHYNCPNVITSKFVAEFTSPISRYVPNYPSCERNWTPSQRAAPERSQAGFNLSSPRPQLGAACTVLVILKLSVHPFKDLF